MRPLQYPAAVWRAVTIPVSPAEGAAIGAVVGAAVLALGCALPVSATAPSMAASAAQVGYAPLRATRAAPVRRAPKVARFAPGRDQDNFRMLNSYYVGRARAPRVDWDNVDLEQNVRFMWQRKAATFTVTPATRKSVDGIVARYAAAPRRLTNLRAYLAGVEQTVGRARAGLDYPRLCAKFSLGSDRCVRLQYMSAGITAEMLTAYSMTELFPSLDGEQNRYMLDLLLRKAGADYLNATPALGDALLSMGPYQFTSYAVRHDADGRQGANIVAEFSTVGLPGSVRSLTPDKQHVAAFYFATYNLLRMVRGLNAQQYAALKRAAPLGKGDLTAFMAAAHHHPGGAIRAASHWLGAGGRGPLAAHLTGRLRAYGKKSASNLRALRGARG